MKIAVIGAGPIGAILSAYLSKIKHHVVLVDVLKDRLELFKKQGITISGVANFHMPIFAVAGSIAELRKKYSKDIAYIFICVKAPVLRRVLPEIRAMKSKAPIVCFQNGLDVEQEAARLLGKDNVLRTVVNYAGNIILAGTEVRMSFFSSPNYIGALSASGAVKAKAAAKLLSDTSLTTSFTDNIRKYTWEKAILNAALAPVCALTGLVMKEAMDRADTYHLVEELLKEGIAVAQAHGYDYGKKFYENCIKYLKNAGPHKPSMLIDVENHQTTEIDFINGKIVEYGKAKKVPVPCNDTVTCLVRAMGTGK